MKYFALIAIYSINVYGWNFLGFGSKKPPKPIDYSERSRNCNHTLTAFSEDQPNWYKNSRKTEFSLFLFNRQYQKTLKEFEQFKCPGEFYQQVENFRYTLTEQYLHSYLLPETKKILSDSNNIKDANDLNNQIQKFEAYSMRHKILIGQISQAEYNKLEAKDDQESLALLQLMNGKKAFTTIDYPGVSNISGQIYITPEQFKARSISRLQNRKKPPKLPAEFKHCTSVELSSPVMNRENIREQGDAHACTEETAADALGYILKERVSDLALTFPVVEHVYNNKKDFRASNNLSYANVHEVVDRVANDFGGFCTEKSFTRNDGFVYTPLYLQSLFKNFVRATTENTDNNECVQCAVEALKSHFPNYDWDNYVKVGDKVGNTFLKELVEKYCPRESRIGKHLAQIQPLFTVIMGQKEKIRAINTELNKDHPIPLVIDAKYLSSVASGPHSVLIVGRKFNQDTNRCDYIIRNSWGKTCTQSPHTTMQCIVEKDSFGAYHTGYLTLSEAELEKYSYGVLPFNEKVP